ncbi:glycosyltransferase family 2 protein [Kistimonas asteriae]|uniref:glycosyltransferase family 2 protein n=1 Tax=Kistimonas asteriae TaxID=517724 RepID=UPI001BA820DF|nr:glycosyltransferase family 2 protein [Kistimonas asteriae]
MLLTVIMSVKNGEPYLSEAIESILNQTYRDYKFIIVNNNSTDKTAEILEYYRNQDSRIEVITNTLPYTYVEGRMLAFEQVTTEWVALMDADDISEPTRLEKQIDAVLKYGNELGAIGVWAKQINKKGRILANSTFGARTIEEFKKLNSTNETIGLIDPTAIIHLPTFYKAGGYRSYTVPAADLDLWYRIAEAGKAVVVIPEFLFKYRVHDSSDSVKRLMLQRKKTHFINYNMRLRRKGAEEVSWDVYCESIWGNIFYRIRKLRTDWAMLFYKKAGICFGENKYLWLMPNLFLSMLIKPEFFFKRIYSQVIRR